MQVWAEGLKLGTSLRGERDSGGTEWGESRREVISSHRQAPGGLTAHIKTASQISILCFVCVCVAIFFQVLSGSASMLKWFGGDHSASHLSLLTTNTDFVASTRQVLESKRLWTCRTSAFGN